MKRLILLAFALYCGSAETAIAEDYLLRFETIGYVDRPATEKNPKEFVLRTIEVVTRPGSAFHGKVQIGDQTLILSGELHPSDRGQFRAHLRYTHLVDIGRMIPTESGGAEPLVNTSSLSADVALAVDAPTVVGGFDSRTASAVPSGYETKVSKARHVLLLTKYDADAN